MSKEASGPFDPILAKQLFLYVKIEKLVEIFFPLSILKILCIFRSENGYLAAALPKEVCF